MNIKFYQRYQPSNQLNAIEDALFSENLASNGKYTDLLTDYFYLNFNIENILFTTSATAALDVAVKLLNLEPGDEIIIPSYNFPSAANAVLMNGGRPILCDIDKLTKNIDIEDASSKITKRTKAIIPTHYAGISCDMDKLMGLAKEFDLSVIEDAAQAVHSCYKHKYLGTIGDFGAYSFHHTKNFSCGEGGAFLSKDRKFTKKAEEIRDNGTNKAAFMRNQVPYYSWQMTGCNYVLGEACSALLFEQMKEAEVIISRRKSIANIYNSFLLNAQVYLNEKITLMEIPEYSIPNYHIYYINCQNLKIRNALMRALLEDGVDARTHFIPLHMTGFGEQLGYKAFDFPNSVNASETLLRLPIHTEMTANDAEFVADHLVKRVKRI